MSDAAQTPLTGNVFDRLALRIRQTSVDTQKNAGTGLMRFKVALTSPLTITELDGDLSLEDGDPDFTVGETLRARVVAGSVEINDLVWVAYQDQEFHAFDVVSR
jgi:hypothetical protein